MDTRTLRHAVWAGALDEIDCKSDIDFCELGEYSISCSNLLTGMNARLALRSPLQSNLTFYCSTKDWAPEMHDLQHAESRMQPNSTHPHPCARQSPDALIKSMCNRAILLEKAA